MAGGADDDSEKSHEASQRKLQEARRKGEIPRSTDMTTAAAYAGFVASAALFGGATLISLGEALLPFLDHPDRLSHMVFAPGSMSRVGGLVTEAILPVLSWMAVPAGLVLAWLVAHQGLLFTPSKLGFKLQRLSPIANAKNKFGRRGLFEFVKSFVKLFIYAACLTLFLRAEVERIVGAILLDPDAISGLLAALILKFLWIVLAVALVLGLIDFLWQRQEHMRSNRMSHKELRDEHKDAEGDPHLKQHRRAKAQEIANNRMLHEVPRADVVIVNPTHYAVALRWSREKGSAPKCVAKGVDEMALQIRRIAAQSRVPIQPDPPTARMLHATVELDAEISPEHYQAVANAIRYAEVIRRKARERGIR